MFDEEDADGDHDFLDEEPTDAERELAPEVDVPSVDPPSVPDASNASPELRRKFWTLVATFNVALLAVSLGVMFVGFRGRWQYGGLMVAFGLVLFALGYRRYQRYTDGGGSDDSDDGE